MSVAPHIPLDRRLAARVARGDDAAWATIDARHRPRLRRYVLTLARPGTIDVDDVVQEAMVKAYRHLSSGRAPAERLDPWLHRIARNSAIDAIRATVRTPDGTADADPADDRTEPERVATGRERLRGIVADIAVLPERQRSVFLARAVDGRSVDEVATEHGISPNAVHMTVQRARETLLRTERARDAACTEIRPLLHDAHDRRTRPAETARLHLRTCAGCRAFRSDLRRLDRRVGALSPPGWLLGLLGAAAPAGPGVKGAAVAAGVGASAVVAGTLVVGGVHVGHAGSPAAIRIPGAKTFGPTRVQAGDPVPRRTSLVHARVRVPASADDAHPRFVTLRCPAGQIVGGLATPEQRTDVRANPAIPILDRRDTAVRWRLYRGGTSSVGDATIGVVCRRPDANGSIVGRPRRARAGERSAHACVLGTTAQRRAKGIPVENGLYARAGGRGYTGRVMDGQPVSVLRTARGGRWLFVIADDRQVRGWIARRLVC
ncbi:sigma-70 family RNA polymerase sigma factor [Patulibacter minatonensis]|uniref:sigma-70 family RNA polymerase sigma factor n=1 Tax=Patulibacter minatonensis TaxID=298163 RepID=UPI00047AB0DF|nr:sigma-70 family RNA polymerase sigma factor [Patulibacter minatonensis]